MGFGSSLGLDEVMETAVMNEIGALTGVTREIATLYSQSCKDIIRIQQSANQKRILTKTQLCRHPHLSVNSLQNYKKYISVVYKPPSL